jgi:hypothetical protein
LIKDKYKGSKKDFINGYKELFDNNFFGVIDPKNMNFLDKLNVYFKIKYTYPDVFMFTEHETQIVTQLETIKNSKESIAVAKQIYDYCLIECEKKSSKKENNVEELTSKTNENFKNSIKKLFDDETKVYNCPKCLNPPVISFSEMFKIFEDVPNNSSVVNELYEEHIISVNIMVQRFLMKKAANTFKKTKIREKGILDTKKLSQYKLSDNIFKTYKPVTKGKSHAFVIFGDWSSSMKDCLSDIMNQMFMISLFCKKLNIPFEIYIFSDNKLLTNKFNKTFEKNNLIKQNPVCLMNIFSSKMTNSDIMKMMRILYDCAYNNNFDNKLLELGATPLDETIICAINIVKEYQKVNNIQIMNVSFLTDGESNSSSKLSGTSLSPRFIRYDKKIYKCIKSTDCLLSILKKQTECNLIGFFVSDVFNQKIRATSKNAQYLTVPSCYEEFNRNGFFVVDPSLHSYDTMFFIGSRRKQLQDEEVFQENVLNKIKGL